MNSKSVIAGKMCLKTVKFRHDILYQSTNLTRILFHSRVMTTTLGIKNSFVLLTHIKPGILFTGHRQTV